MVLKNFKDGDILYYRGELIVNTRGFPVTTLGSQDTQLPISGPRGKNGTLSEETDRDIDANAVFVINIHDMVETIEEALNES